jgi:hypothetical protein
MSSPDPTLFRLELSKDGKRLSLHYASRQISEIDLPHTDRPVPRKGWVLVPRKPTAAMIEAGYATDQFAANNGLCRIERAWPAMVDEAAKRGGR